VRDVFNHICSNLVNIIKNNPVNIETQFKLEIYLLNQDKDLAKSLKVPLFSLLYSFYSFY